MVIDADDKDTHINTNTDTDIDIDININTDAAAQDARNRTLAVHKRVDCRFLVLPGSLSTFTDITGHKFFSLLQPLRELKYKSD